jgi:hypothetical protein
LAANSPCAAAFRTRNGVAGISTSVTLPRASTMALITVGGAPTVDARALRRSLLRQRSGKSCVEPGVLRPRHAIIHERSGQQLPRGVVERHVLHQRLADAHREPAVNLALEQQRIDDDAGIVDADVTRDLDAAGVGIDLDLADVAAVGEVRTRRREGADRFEADAEFGRPACRRV